MSPTTGDKFGQTHLFDKNTLAFNSRSLKDEVTEERFQPETGHSMPNSYVQSQIMEDPELELMDQGSSSNVPSSTAEKFESNLKEAAEIIRLNQQREDPGGQVITETENYESSFHNEVTESVARGETLSLIHI